MSEAQTGCESCGMPIEAGPYCHHCVGSDGKPLHHEWTGKFDGKDYPVTGDPTQDARSYKKVDDRTLDMTVKKGGKTAFTGHIVVAADGKSRTVTISGTDKDGKPATSTAVYDKQ